MTNLLQQIREDHVSAARILELVERKITGVQKEAPPDMELLEEAIRYMINYSDTIHHPREDTLFGVLGERDPGLADQVQALRREHQELAALSSAFLEIIRAAEYGDFVPREDVLARSRRYVDFLREHMKREERHLLKRAEAMLSARDLEDIDAQHAATRDPLRLDSLKNEYAALYRYLVP